MGEGGEKGESSCDSSGSEDEAGEKRVAECAVCELLAA